jgi:hypothetical protein
MKTSGAPIWQNKYMFPFAEPRTILQHEPIGPTFACQRRLETAGDGSHRII